MAVKPKPSVKSKTSSKHKEAVNPNKKISSRQSDFSHLAEDIISNINIGIYIVQKEKFVYVSPLFQKLSGYSYADLAGTNPVDYIHPDDREDVRKKAIISLKGKSSDAYEYRFARKNGEVIWILEIVTSITHKGKQAALGSFMDITERKKIEEAMHQSEERYRNILESIQEGYFELDLAGNYTFVNEANCRFLGYTKEELVGMNYRQHTDEENAKKLYQPYRELYRTGKPIETLEVESFRKDGIKVIYETSISLMRDSKGKSIGFRGVSRDITERKRAEEKIQYMATHDSLTELPNRLMFSQLINHAIQAARRYQRQFAVLFIDLDRFKVINDTMGHEAGDQLLQEIAIRLKQTMRTVDIVARLGGDEFVILIEEISDSSQAATVSRNILATIIKPITIKGQECHITASIGISVFPKDAEDEQSLMKNADIAMYLAKEEGKNNYQFYSEDIQLK